MGALFVWAVVCPAETTRVADIVDGDSLRLTDGRQVRLIGINTPEYGKDGAPNEPLAREARALLSRLVAGKEVWLEYGPERLDRYRRTLAYVRLADGTNVEEVMLRQGMAFAVAIPPNLAHVGAYLRAENEARRAGRGVWADRYFQPRDAATLDARDVGFRFVRAQVRRVEPRRDTIYLDLTDRFALAIAREQWSHFGGTPDRLLGKHVIVRGWIAARKTGLRLQLTHPAMLEVID